MLETLWFLLCLSSLWLHTRLISLRAGSKPPGLTTVRDRITQDLANIYCANFSLATAVTACLSYGFKLPATPAAVISVCFESLGLGLVLHLAAGACVQYILVRQRSVDLAEGISEEAALWFVRAAVAAIVSTIEGLRLTVGYSVFFHRLAGTEDERPLFSAAIMASTILASLSTIAAVKFLTYRERKKLDNKSGGVRVKNYAMISFGLLIFMFIVASAQLAWGERANVVIRLVFLGVSTIAAPAVAVWRNEKLKKFSRNYLKAAISEHFPPTMKKLFESNRVKPLA